MNFFTKPPLLLFLGPNGLCGAFQGKNITNEEFGHFCLKTPPKSFFRKKTFSVRIFLQNHPAPIFPTKQTMWRVSRQNCPGQKLRSLLPKTPRNSFSEKRVSGLNFFTKPPPHLFSRPNGLCGAFQGKIVPDKNFTGFCLKRPQNCFSAKHVSGPNLFTKPPHTYFRSQIDYVTRFEAKFSQTKSSFGFALNAPKIVFV